MSDHQPDPTWWRASDGKWYPPQQAGPPAAPLGMPAFCTNCGRPMHPGASVCTACGFARNTGGNHCGVCAAPTTPGQAVCLSCGSALTGAAGGGPRKERIVAGVLAILLGYLGVHKFYLGQTGPGIILLAVTVVSICCGWILIVPLLGLVATSVISIVEGVIILTKSDEEFQQIYVIEGREWF
jgi:TM2 domain-containing membrane protein YozV